MICTSLTRRIQNAVCWVCEVPIERCHLVLGDGILDGFERGLFGGFGSGGIGELENVLRQLQIGVLGKLRITHLDGRVGTEGGRKLIRVVERVGGG